MGALVEGLTAWISETLWPAILALLARTGATKVLLLLRDWLTLFFAEKVLRGLLGIMVISIGMGGWATFLAVFWTFSSWGALRDFFNADPFSGVSVLAGGLYLASNFFPFHFFFGISIAYIQWRLTMIHAAIILNRLMFLILTK